MKVTLGGDRLGSGNKNKIGLRNYERSTHNLSRKFTSSMQCGTLYPFMVIPAMRGDKFTINLDADARTIPTKGPLFGSFKMQVDLFQCDVRLYQAILHNNPLAIGLKMGQVKFPQLELKDHEINGRIQGISNSCLLKYLGLSGLGVPYMGGDIVTRNINAIPALAYYEIFKTYYSNKQEENAYVIGTEKTEIELSSLAFYDKPEDVTYGIDTEIPINNEIEIEILHGAEYAPSGYEDVINVVFMDDDSNVILRQTIANGLKYPTGHRFIEKINKGTYKIYKGYSFLNDATQIKFTPYGDEDLYVHSERGLEPFKLANIDEMRLLLLSHHELGTPFIIGENGDWDEESGADNDGMPYAKLFNQGEDGIYNNHTPLNGLCVKTYQSDLFNNWVNTDWIDGENGIANVTAISTAGGSIKIDSLNLSEKLYNMLNRVAVSDGSYEGWQDAVYTETPKRHIESPIYLGGMSSEIVFEEIVQTAPTNNSALGTLGGKGKLLKRKGGHVTVKCNEACFIIGIVSLTPRVNYTQGNEFYLTDLMSMDDFHKPALDGIGFQNLIGERMAWWDTIVDSSGVVRKRSTVGKVPAWIEYMTAVDKAYGDFAETEGRGFMSLNREYDRDGSDIADATTYIDPRKYNYAFAYTDIDAQNFWVQIYADIKARRLMSAKQIPNI